MSQEHDNMRPPEPLGEPIRLASLPDRLPIIERIMAEAIEDDMVQLYRRRAQFTFFCGSPPAQAVGYESQLEAVGRCLEWFVFDYVVPELAATPAQHWLIRRAENLTPDERADARHCLRPVLGLFEVATVTPGERIELRDILREPLSYVVKERVVSEELTAGQLLVGRLFPYRSGYALSGMVAVMDQEATRQIRRLVAWGEINPAALLRDLDGVELENLMGRRVDDIEDVREVAWLEDRLMEYLHICGAAITWDMLREMVRGTDQPLRAAASLAGELEICGRHEMDLFFALVTALWCTEHGSEPAENE